jgi:hypothetical protein
MKTSIRYQRGHQERLFDVLASIDEDNRACDLAQHRGPQVRRPKALASERLFLSFSLSRSHSTFSPSLPVPTHSNFAMHRALALQEIVSEIVFHAAAVPNDSLVVLVRTCKIFSEPALDLLWKDASLWHLAQCIDAELWDTSIIPVEHGTGTFTRLVSDHVRLGYKLRAHKTICIVRA